MACTPKNGGIRVDFPHMSPEEIERTMQFLLRQQAQFAADFERRSEEIDKLRGEIDNLKDAVVGLTGIAGHTLRVVEQLGAQVGQLGAHQQRTDERLRELAEQVQRTDSHLDVLIQMFERHLREDHGPRPS
jgi:chromosome segregation ATPase